MQMSPSKCGGDSGPEGSAKRPSRVRRRLGPGGTLKGVDASPIPAPEANSWSHELYGLAEVRAALGLALGYGPGQKEAHRAWDGLDPDAGTGDTEHQGRLRAILAAGERSRWRQLAAPSPSTHDAIGALAARAPHFDALATLVRTNVRAALNMAVPTFLAPVLLLGRPGVGKTWFLSCLGRVLGLPFRAYTMSSSTLGEGVSGAHPSWRNAAPGLIAKTLLQERLANPVVFVDELDKAQPHFHNSDPYRPFYALLEPAGAKMFTDEYLGFAIDASRVLWVLAANDASALPDAILDRLTVIEVPEMTQEQRAIVAESLYAEANGDRRQFFEPTPSRSVLDRLALLSPRSARLAVEHAMARAAADGRRELREDDVRPRPSRAPLRMGFR